MRYRFTLQERDGSWVYVLGFGKDTPTQIEQVVEYSDSYVSAEDHRGVRHYVYTQDGKIVSIHLHDVTSILPHIDPNRPETLRMPAMHAILFGNPPVPTLLLRFREEPTDTRTMWALSPNVFLVFHDGELAHLYVADVYSVIAEVD
jgi:hypothetical protein